MSVAINTTSSQVTAKRLSTLCYRGNTRGYHSDLYRTRTVSVWRYFKVQSKLMITIPQVDEVVDALSELLRRIPDRVSSKDYAIDTRPFTSISAINE